MARSTTARLVACVVAATLAPTAARRDSRETATPELDLTMLANTVSREQLGVAVMLELSTSELAESRTSELAVLERELADSGPYKTKALAVFGSIAHAALPYFVTGEAVAAARAGLAAHPILDGVHLQIQASSADQKFLLGDDALDAVILAVGDKALPLESRIDALHLILGHATFYASRTRGGFHGFGPLRKDLAARMASPAALQAYRNVVEAADVRAVEAADALAGTHVRALVLKATSNIVLDYPPNKLAVCKDFDLLTLAVHQIADAPALEERGEAARFVANVAHRSLDEDLSVFLPCLNRLVEIDVLPALVRLVKESDVAVFTEDALIAMANILCDNEETELALVRTRGAVDQLLSVLRDRGPGTHSRLAKQYATAALTNAMYVDGRSIRDAGGLAAYLDLLETPYSEDTVALEAAEFSGKRDRYGQPNWTHEDELMLQTEIFKGIAFMLQRSNHVTSETSNLFVRSASPVLDHLQALMKPPGWGAGTGRQWGTGDTWEASRSYMMSPAVSCITSLASHSTKTRLALIEAGGLSVLRRLLDKDTARPFLQTGNRDALAMVLNSLQRHERLRPKQTSSFGKIAWICKLLATLGFLVFGTFFVYNEVVGSKPSKKTVASKKSTKKKPAPKAKKGPAPRRKKKASAPATEPSEPVAAPDDDVRAEPAAPPVEPPEVATLKEALKEALAARKVPESLVCPITFTLMDEPVLLADGHTYERCAIEEWLGTGARASPVTNAPLAHLTLTPNHTVKALTVEYLEEARKLGI